MNRFIDWMLGDKESTYWGIVATALMCGFLAVMGIIPGKSWYFVFSWYIAATLFRLLAGAIMNRMGDAATVNAWSNKYHRVVVIALNAGVGAVLLGRVVYDWFAHHAHGEQLAFLTALFALYLVVTKFTRPNTWGERVRFAFLTVGVAMVMAWINWPHHEVLVGMAGTIAFCIAGYRLDQLQRRFGWETR